MADYQEYRRRILRKRWRRNFAVAGLLVLLILLSAVGLLWKRLHREQSPAAVQGPTIFQQELQSSEWNTISYTPARRLTVQTTLPGPPPWISGWPRWTAPPPWTAVILPTSVFWVTA